MSNPVLTAAMLIEANGAALNNAGNDTGQRLDNAVVVKQVRVGKNSYPYVSGQAIRRWWREVLYEDFAWEPSPVTREAKSAYTEGDPVKYPDDDMFGYMAAKKVKRGAKRQKKADATPELDLQVADNTEGAASPTVIEADEADTGGTQRRVSPLKNSLLVSVLPRVTASDFGHFTRNLPVGTDPVLFEHEHYTTLMQGVFTLSLQDVGRFECGLMRDIPLDAPISDGVEVFREAQGNLKPRILCLGEQERRKRITETLQAVGRLRHGANLARNLTDVAPVVLLLGYLDGGNAPFQSLFTAASDEGVNLNVARLSSVIKDYKDRFLGDQKLYFGYRPGVLSNEAEAVAAMNAGIEGVTFFVGTPGEAISQAAALADVAGIL